MGLLRLVGSLKLYVSFAEYRLFYRALLQKRPRILRNLLIVATPYAVRWQICLPVVGCEAIWTPVYCRMAELVTDEAIRMI